MMVINKRRVGMFLATLMLVSLIALGGTPIYENKVAWAEPCAKGTFTPTEDIKSRARIIFSELKKKGFNDTSAAALIGNGVQESSLSPGAKGDSGLGIWQWTGGRRSEVEKFAQKNNMPLYEIPTQVAAIYDEITKREHAFPSSPVPSGYERCIKEVGLSLPKPYQGGVDEFIKAPPGDIERATLIFATNWERCSHTQMIPEKRVGAAKWALKEFAGLEPSSTPSGGLQGPGGELNLSENDIVGMPKVKYLYGKQVEIEVATKQGLGVQESVNLVDTKNAIKDRKDNLMSGYVRIGIMFLGIGMFIWAVVIVIAFGMDKVFNPEVSMGRLVTFTKGDKKYEPLSVGSFLAIVGVVIAVGVIIVSGLAYKIVMFLGMQL